MLPHSYNCCGCHTRAQPEEMLAALLIFLYWHSYHTQHTFTGVLQPSYFAKCHHFACKKHARVNTDLKVCVCNPLIQSILGYIYISISNQAISCECFFLLARNFDRARVQHRCAAWAHNYKCLAVLSFLVPRSKQPGNELVTLGSAAQHPQKLSHICRMVALLFAEYISHTHCGELAKDQMD